MKKFFAITALVACVAANAAEVSVNYVRDLAVDANGVSLVVSPVKLGALRPEVSVSYVNNQYTRLGVGASYDVATLMGVNFAVRGTGVFQNTTDASNGYGLVAGAVATYPLTKSVNVNVGVERFLGQSKIDGFNGTTATVGLSTKF